jgi:glucans biosynthesis protein
MTDDQLQQSAEPVQLRSAPRCGAKSRRTGKPCQAPKVHGRPRCRMHGCGRGSGGPKGERNGNYKHGLCTQEAAAEMQQARRLMREAKLSLR